MPLDACFGRSVAYAKGERTNASDKEMAVLSAIVRKEDFVVDGKATILNAVAS